VRCGQCRNVWHASLADAMPEEEALSENATASAPANASQAAAPPPAPPPPPAPAASEEPADEEDWGAAFADEATAKAGAEVPAVPAPAAALTETAPPLVEGPTLVPENSIEMLATRRSRKPFAAAPFKRAKAIPFYKRFSPSMTIVAASVIVVALIVANRVTIVRYWPGTAEIFETFGLRVNLRGLDFQDITTNREVQDGVTVLTISGNIVNQSRYTTDIPKLRFAVRDAGGREIYTWTAGPQRPLLESGEVLPFRSRLASPPPEGRDVMVRFLTRKDLGG
jgi:hypothetical protein